MFLTSSQSNGIPILQRPRIKATARKIARYLPFIYRPSFLTRPAVVWAYRLLLDRNPENRTVIREKLSGPITDIPNLRRDLILSAEFANKSPDLAPFPPQSIVIKELSCGRRLYVDLGDHEIGTRIVRDRYEQDFVEILAELVPPAATVLDIGANIGFFTIHLAHLVGKNGTVVAFEPINELRALLEKSIRENQFQDRIRLESAALGAESGHAEILYIPEARNQGTSYLVAEGSSDCTAAHELRRVNVLALDEYPLPDTVTFIKIDIEGAEPLFVRGATRCLRDDRPVVMSEVHPEQLRRVSNVSPAEYVGQFTSMGYRCLTETRHGFTTYDAHRAISDPFTAIFVPQENPSTQEFLLRAASRMGQ